MMTTLRSDRRTRRNAMFDLECLDDRIVLSASLRGRRRGGPCRRGLLGACQGRREGGNRSRAA